MQLQTTTYQEKAQPNANKTEKVNPRIEQYQLTYYEKVVNIESLKPHPFLEKLGLQQVSEYYIGAAKRFSNYYDKPVIGADNLVLSNWHEIEAARANGLKQITVVECTGLRGNNILDFINWRAYQEEKKDYRKLYEVMMDFEKIYEDESCEWFNSLPGDKDDKLGAVIGRSGSMAKQLRCIGANAPLLFEEIKENRMSFNQAYKLVNKAAQNTLKQGTNKTVGQVPEWDIENMSLSISNGNSYQMTVTDKVPQIYFNGSLVQSTQTSYSGIQYPESIHYSFQVSETETIQVAYIKK